MCDKYGLPDFAYQAKVVSREQKNDAKAIIRDIVEGMIEQSKRTEPDKNHTIVTIHRCSKQIIREGQNL